MKTQRWLILSICLLSLPLWGCGEDGSSDPGTTDGASNGGDNNSNGKTDNGGGENPFLAELADRADPIGIWLRENADINDEGLAELDYVRLVTGLSDQQGCSPSAIRTFLISDTLITGDEPFPRTVTVVCGDDPGKASNLFLSAPSATEDGDIDIRTVEMFAWDPTARRYRFYRIDPVEGSDTEASVDIEPSECSSCHLGAKDMDPANIPMIPIMNELTLPWPHWGSSPDAEDHSFHVSDDVKERENYNACVTPWMGTAPNLEQIIRKGFENVNTARLRARRERPASVEVGMSLLRPLFCNERINFVTEDGGNVLAGAYIDEGAINMYKSLGDGAWSWSWYTDRKVRIGTPDTPDEELTMIPVRGAADVDYEQRLVSVRGLTAEQVLRVKALDWKRPVYSAFRCGLWNQASARLRIQPPEFPEDYRTSNLLPILYDDIMQITASSGASIPLTPGDAGAVIAIAEADEATVTELADIIEAELLPDTICADGPCAADLETFGGLLDDYIKAIEADDARRDNLRTERNARACITLELYPNAPDIPGVVGCETGE